MRSEEHALAEFTLERLCNVSQESELLIAPLRARMSIYAFTS